MSVRRPLRLILAVACALAGAATALRADYANFESGHVHPIALTPSGGRLLAVNTPDALLELFDVQPDGSLVAAAPVAVGLEPVTVVARTDTEAWVVNNLSDSISIVDLVNGVVTRTIYTPDEPTDVVFTGSRAFVAVSQLDLVRVYDLGNLDAAPTDVPLFGRDIRALAVSAPGPNQKVYAVALRSGNETAVVNANIIFGPNNSNLNGPRLTALGLRDLICDPGLPPAYPPLPPGITRNPALSDPPPGNDPPVGLIVRWNRSSGRWEDEIGADWSHCLPFRLPDLDLFVIDAATLAVTEVAHLGTSLFDVSVHPNGKLYVSGTDGRNFVRFEHPLGVQGHAVDNRLSIVDPSAGNSVTLVDLNAHINRASDPATNLAERQASMSQPGMLRWKADGSFGYLAAIGSRKVFRVDGACLADACIFGPTRATPVAVEVGEGPTGVALAESKDRLYVLNRISHSVAIVQPSTMTLIGEIALHDPSSAETRDGRRFLYDAIDTSGHGDAACSSCHLFGDMDGLAWDLGNPEGQMAAYTEPLDNVRFVVPQGGVPVECDQSVCAAHDGFDPQKGPMTTQTLRGMLEPLHWRGDRSTMNDFNQAFPALMGTADIGPINGKPAGLSAADMELFRQFALGLRYPPNPFRNVDDTTPCGPRASDPGCEVQVHGSLFPGNPTEGASLFDNHVSDAGQPCVACHAHPFGAAGGKLGGVPPTDPVSSDAAALFFGTADGSPHNDLKISHLRNIHDKFGPVWAGPGGPPPDTKTGFGLTHDGSVPDIFHFLAANVFSVNTTQLRDLAAFMFHFPTETKPAVGRQLTVAQGTPPTGTGAQEALLATLLGLGDLADANRHCELVATTIDGGRQRRYHYAAGNWVSDVAGEPALTTTALREGADDRLTFTCAPLGSGARLGGNRDEDPVLDGDDCAPADGSTFDSPSTLTGLALSGSATTSLTWDDQASGAGASMRYDVLGGDLSALRASGLAATGCVEAGIDVAGHTDLRPAPAANDGYFYLVRARNPCGTASLGPGRESLDGLACGARAQRWRPARTLAIPASRGAPRRPGAGIGP